MRQNTLFYNSIFIRSFVNQKDLITSLVNTKQIKKATYLSEIMFLSLPDNNLVKHFIVTPEKINSQLIKVTGFIDSKGKLKSNTESV